tara:strand:- start:873 stop:1808 length:936 start_codon:yes stop_codon:yes gene_type:complete
MNLEPKGGTEILKKELGSRLKEKDLKGINLIKSVCHPQFLDKEKINIVWQHLSYDQPNVQLMKDRRFVDQVDYFVYVSHWQFNKFREHFAIPEYKSFVIKNATPLPSPRINIVGGRVQIMYSSTPWRGLSVLLLAIDILNKKRDDFTLNVYSSTEIYGKTFNDMESDKYKVLFERCKNTKNVKYHGFVENDEILKQLTRTHIYAYPSIFEETSCLSAIEAMIAGCKVVTTNYGALPETCGEFASMIEFEPNLAELAKRYAVILGQAIDNYKDGLYKKQLENQVEYYKNHYSWDVRILEWRNFLNHVRKKNS